MPLAGGDRRGSRQAMERPVSPILILTATVVPPSDATNLARVDPALRLADYAQALRLYVRYLERSVISGIVFAENSQADISSLKELVAGSPCAGRIEFLQFAGLDHPGSCGRGYGEFKLIDFAMRESSLINEAAQDAEIWKITGRYEVVNLAEILARRSQRCSLWAHCRNLPQRWADMYLLGWRRGFYESYLRGLYHQLDQSSSGASAELMFRDKVDALATADAKAVCRRFPAAPELQGVRGLDGAAYSDQNLKQWLRRFCHLVLPWVWI